MHEPTTAIFGLDPLWLSCLILIVTYAIIISERLNRAIIALTGAGLMIMCGVLNQEMAVRGIDFNTIALLTGMMIIVAITRKCGVFQYVAIRAAKSVKANPAGVLLMLQIITAIFSALLDNVTTVLLIVPVTLVICDELKIKPYPVLVAEIFASNVGGTATLIGDPPNILIGSATGLSFNEFLFNLAPIALVIQIVYLGIFHLIWGRKMRASTENRARVMAMDEKKAITDIRLLKQSMGVLALVILGFVMAHPLHLEPGTIAMSGAAILMLLDNFTRSAEEQSEHVHHTFGEVEWITIFFFVGLFIVVAGVEHAGLLNLLAQKMLALTGGDLTATVLAILWASAILSAIVDNIPFVATMIPLIENMAPAFGGPEGLKPLWWALALGACLGGNGTLIGASANLTVAGLAERGGVRIRFLPFMKLAFPLMLISIVLSTAYVMWRYL
ncbi:MAG: ArsB/NhaD family transporter [Rhodospirillales bacterium]|jgi:Na+/H+ antiporter NhaD/arsenite permease-like protein